MIKIFKRISQELVKKYVYTASLYLEKMKKDRNIDFNINENERNITEILCNVDFKNTYDTYLKNTNFKNLFSKSESNNSDKKSIDKSIYTDFREIIVKIVKNDDDEKSDKNIKRKNEKDYYIKDLLLDIVKDLGINVCPYCGRNFIGVIDSNKQLNSEEDVNKTNMSCLDHFYLKSKNEEFSISLYNLIPSCYVCNSLFKHDKDVLVEEYKILFPYKEGFEDNIKFNFQFEFREEQEKYINALTGGKHDIDSVKIRLVKRKIIKLNSRNIDGEEMNSYIERCINSNTMFHLEELYNEYHHQNAVDLVNKVVWFRDNYLKSTSNILKKTLGENFHFLFGRWLNKDNDLKEPLSKFYRDIYEQITDPHIYEPLMKDSTNKEVGVA